MRPDAECANDAEQVKRVARYRIRTFRNKLHLLAATDIEAAPCSPEDTDEGQNDADPLDRLMVQSFVRRPDGSDKKRQQER